MKNLFLFLFFIGGIFFSYNLYAQCDMTFNPSGNVYNPGDSVSITICFQDYTAGFPQYEKADWDLDDDGNWDITVTGDDGTGISFTALGGGNTMNSTFCVKVEFVAGSQGNLISITATAEGLTNGCQHTQVQNYTLLPIILESFEVAQKGDYAVLNWITASEFNNDFYTLEMSVDGENFEDIGEVKGAGTTLERKEYSFKYKLNKNLEVNPFIYFRLRQTDFDGLTSHSDVVLLSNNINNKTYFSINKVTFQNPDVSFDVSSTYTGNIQVRIVDISGNIIYSQTWGVDRGINSLNIPLDNYHPGIHVLQVMNNNNIETKKLFIH